MSKIIYNYGVMGASKSAQLLMTGFNFEEKGFFVYYAKPSLDTRDVGAIKSRINLKKECYIIHEKDYIDSSFFETCANGLCCDVLMIDECQFLKKEQVLQIVELAGRYDITVMFYGLKTDSNMELFEGSKAVIEVADEIREIESTCKCGNKATVNARLSDGVYIKTKNTIAPEVGKIRYESVCRLCWYKGLNN